MRFANLVFLFLLTLLQALPAVAYESNPGAMHTLLIDFGEYTVTEYWPYRSGQGPVNPNGAQTSPALFDGSGAENFTQAQQDDFIFKIWRRVAEDYSPLDVNVVTEAASNFDSLMANGLAARVAVGGRYNDIGENGGKAPPRGYMRPEMARNAFASGRHGDYTLRTVTQIARTVSHEAAHMYGSNYHYLDPVYDPSATCFAADTPGLHDAHLSNYPTFDRDGWWSALGFGLDDNGNPECRLRGDVGELWNALGERPPLSDPNSTNPLLEVSSTTLIGSGIVTNNNATYVREQWVDFVNDPYSCSEPVCEFNPSWLGSRIGHGPNMWIFKASGGSVRITVNTINRDSVPNSRPLIYIDETSANLNADFTVWVANSSSLDSWTSVVDSANPQSGDSYSAEKTFYVPPNDPLRTYVVWVRSRGGYGELGQYSIEVYGDGNVDAYLPAMNLKTPAVRIPTVTLNPTATKKTTTPTITIQPQPRKTTVAPKLSAPKPVFSFSR